MTYESFEVVELGKAEVEIELGKINAPEEVDRKFFDPVAPYVEFDE